MDRYHLAQPLIEKSETGKFCLASDVYPLLKEVEALRKLEHVIRFHERNKHVEDLRPTIADALAEVDASREG